MARPSKKGLDYFPLDVNLQHDDKLQMIIGEFGYKGEIIFIKLLSFIYKTDGYFCTWNEETQLKFANSVSYIIGGSQVNLINEIVNRCLKWGLFDKSVFSMFKILTSKRIQETFKEASRKRKCALIDEDYNLLLVNGGYKTEETQKNTEETTQSKLNENKVNKLIINSVFLEANLSNQIWLETQSMQNKISIDEVKQKLNEFCIYLTSCSDTKYNQREFNTHFTNWLKRNLPIKYHKKEQNKSPLL